MAKKKAAVPKFVLFRADSIAVSMPDADDRLDRALHPGQEAAAALEPAVLGSGPRWP
ncbi:hypothetical protein [Streptomyces sp. NPDC058092]|uniref:hypothetical protein n=1 Tax=Streptomyces sp. NPDC058092 TaxID=3346336 RepID=UPI0036EAE7A1